jgi:hypothetical protein
MKHLLARVLTHRARAAGRACDRFGCGSLQHNAAGGKTAQALNRWARIA